MSTEAIRKWGYYEVLDKRDVLDGQVCVKLLHVLPGKNLSYQKHFKRAETWKVIQGSGLMVLDKKIFEVSPGDTINVRCEQWHSILAKEKLLIAEIQNGTRTEEEDIQRMFVEWPDIKRYCAECFVM